MAELQQAWHFCVILSSSIFGLILRFLPKICCIFHLHFDSDQKRYRFGGFVYRPSDEKSFPEFCLDLSFSALTLLVGDRKGIRFQSIRWL